MTAARTIVNDPQKPEHDARRHAEDAMGKAKRKADEVGVGMREQFGHLRDAASDGARHAADKARDYVSSAASEQKSRVSQTVEGVGEALRSASKELKKSKLEGMAPYLERGADTVDEAAAYLRDKDPGDMLNDARSIARNHPGVYLATAAVAGFALGRFLKASAERQSSQHPPHHARPARSEQRGPIAQTASSTEGAP